MRGSLLHSLLELAHATSQNLGFAHRDDVHVSYGEETITETNLLELRRRHPAIITLNTFGKKKEAKNGADWEWHIIGRHRTFRMRVQAKRLQKDDKLKIPHKVKSSGDQQIDLLIKDAKANRLKPVYCLYSAERQRDHWKKENVGGGYEAFEAGCLLAHAQTVKAMIPKTLADIETDCVPWHYLVERRDYAQRSLTDVLALDGSILRFMVSSTDVRVATGSDRSRDSAAAGGFPTLDELNAPDRPEREIEGLVEVDEPEFERRGSEAEYRERGIGRLVKIDVREFPERPEPKGQPDE
ncbi:DUF6615 family protein [Sulfitobacter sp. AS59]|uniref:DUF6615 family protein n=1 Tax=Sulfitobacter sp. AS59 TaxID=3135784 RepID=UPI00317546CA